MNPAKFTSLIEGKEVKLYTLENENGMVCQVTNYGCCIVSLVVPNRLGKDQNVVLGYDSLAEYMRDRSTCLGAVVGRYANRISDAQFTIDGSLFRLDNNHGNHHIHGGTNGFNRQVWNVIDHGKNFIQMSLLSPHLDAGYPGNVKVTVSYEVSEENALEISYSAETDLPTHINMTNHSYFNLTGNSKESILDHVLQINADSYTPIDSSSIPTGQISPVKGTPFDFSIPKAIRDGLDMTNEQIAFANGFDHNFVLNGSKFKSAAEVRDNTSGIKMEVLTNEPGLQFYTGNSLTLLNNSNPTSGFAAKSGFCLETQHFPDSPNKPHFPSTLLSPDKLYKSRCTYKFSVLD